MSKRINRIYLQKLWNSEYTIFVSQIIAIIGKFQPAVLHLEKAFQKLAAFIPELAKIKAQELSNAISRKLSLLDFERDNLYKLIVAIVKALGRINLPEFNPHVAVMKNFIKIHGEDIPDAPYNAETKRINDMMNDFNSKEDVKLAAETLPLKILFDKLFEINTTFNEEYMKRSEEEAAEEKVNTRAVRKETDKALKGFYTAIDFCSAEYEELDYEPLVNVLNTHISYYKTQLKARETRRKNGEDVSNEEPIVGPE